MYTSIIGNMSIYIPEPRARPTHWQKRTEPKTKPHTLPAIRHRRVFHCRNCLPFVVIVVDEE